MDIPKGEWIAVDEASHAVIREAKDAGFYVFGVGINTDAAPLGLSGIACVDAASARGARLVSE